MRIINRQFQPRANQMSLAFVVAIALMAAISTPPSRSLAAHNADTAVEEEAKVELKPATRYSGRTPVDLSNGIPFNNGTYGKPNPEIEKWGASALTTPSLSELNYPFEEKARFVSGCRESLEFLEAAIANWQAAPSAITKPEAKEYREQAAKTMAPVTDRLKAAIKKADGSSRSDWEKAQAEARNAVAEARATYSDLHKNVAR